MPREWYEADALDVAPALVGRLLTRDDGRCGRILEVEAYRGADDPGSHAYRGPTPRTASMFGPAGHLYVYFTYGMHWCANVVCGKVGTASAVLLRAADPVQGLDLMRAARWRGQRHQTDRDLCRGPARLCQAFDVTGSDDGADLVSADRGLSIVDDGAELAPVAVSRRVGLRAGADLPWRFYVAGHPGVSGPGVAAE